MVPAIVEIWLVLSGSTFGQYSLSVLFVSILGEPLPMSILSRHISKKNFNLMGAVIVEILLVLSASTFGQYSLSVLLVCTLGEPLYLSI